MPKLLYPFDPPAFWRRISLITMLGGVSVLIGLMFMLENLDAWREIGRRLLILPMLLLFIWDIALPLFVRQRIEDGLRIDENGIARIMGDREEFWSWGDVSDIRLHSGWHPMSLFIGRSISFRGPRPARRSRLVGLVNRIAFGGRNIAIGNNYLVVSEELADRLNRYRDMATGSVPKTMRDVSVRTPEPVLFTARDALDNGKRSKAVLILLGMAVMSVAVMVGIMTWWDGRLPTSVEEFVDSDRIIAVLFPAFLLFTQSLSQHFWQSSPATNLILAAAGGLYSSKGLHRKLWRWDEIADIEVKAAAAEKGRESSETVSFTAIHDGTKPGKPVVDGKAGALASVFEDAYDAPPREIARKLETWAEWGQAHAGPVTPESMGEAETAARSMTVSIRYERQGARSSGALRAPAFLVFWLIQLGDLAALLALNPLIRDGALGPVLSFSLLAILGLLLIASFVILLVAVGRSFNYLEIGRGGLVYRRLGVRKTYGWHELAPFELHSARLRWSRVRRPIILFAAPRDDRLSRYMRWAYGIGGIQPRIVIEDVYGVAVSEILAVLEKNRRQGGRVSRRPAA